MLPFSITVLQIIRFQFRGVIFLRYSIILSLKSSKEYYANCMSHAFAGDLDLEAGSPQHQNS